MSRHTPLRVAFAKPYPGTRRGLILWLFSIGYILIGGVQFIGTEVPEITRQYLAFPFDFADPMYWGWLFVVVGVFGLWASYCHFGRDRYGYTVLSVYALMWGGAFVCGYLFYDASVRALGASVLWFVFSGVLSLIAGFPNVSLSPPPLLEDSNSAAEED